MPSPHPTVPKTDHPVLPVIAERWSPYAFEPRPIEREKLLSCLEAAGGRRRATTSSRGRLFWRSGPMRRRLRRLLDCLVEGNQAWAKNAGVLLVTVVSQAVHEEWQAESGCRARYWLGRREIGAASHGPGAARASDDRHRARESPRDLQRARGHEPLTAIALGYPAAVSRVLPIRLPSAI